MATISVRVNKRLSGFSAVSGAIGYVYLLKKARGADAPRTKLIAGPVAVPVGPNPRARASVSVGPGEYLLQVRMPSGADLTESVVVKRQDSHVSVTLEADHSPHEWLSVDHYLGRIPSRQTHERLEQLPNIARDLKALELSVATSPGTYVDIAQDTGDLLRGIEAQPPIVTKARTKGSRSTGRSREGQVRGFAPPADGTFSKSLPATVPAARLAEAISIVEAAESKWSTFRAESVPALRKLSANLPAWQIVTSRGDSAALRDDQTNDERLAWWVGGITASRRLSVSTSDEFYLKAKIPGLTPRAISAAVSSSSTGRDKVPPVLASAIPLRSNRKGRRRSYFALLANGGLSRLGVLPVPWNGITPGPRRRRATGAELLINYRAGARLRGANDTAPQASLQCGVSIDDPDMLAILGFLKSGNVVGTPALLAQAEQALFMKVENPLAAAGAGYLLLQFFDAKQARNPRWRHWVLNLSRWFDAVPDGAIQHGWLELQYASLAQVNSSRKTLVPRARQHFESARDSLLTAMQRGIPYYPQGVRLLVDGLTLILENDVNEGNEYAAETRAALAAARWLSLRVDSREVFTVLKLASE